MSLPPCEHTHIHLPLVNSVRNIATAERRFSLRAYKPDLARMQELYVGRNVSCGDASCRERSQLRMLRGSMREMGSDRATTFRIRYRRTKHE